MSKVEEREARIVALLSEYPSGLRGVEIADPVGRGFGSNYIYLVLARMQEKGVLKAQWGTFEGRSTRRFALRESQPSTRDGGIDEGLAY